MGLADRKRRRSIRVDAAVDNVESVDDVGKEVSHDDDETLASFCDEFFDSPFRHTLHLLCMMPT
jgi:hypothetical protein